MVTSRRRSQRRSRKSQRRSQKSQRRSRKSQRRSQKSQRRSQKSQRRSQKSQRRSRKSQRRSRKSQRRSRSKYILRAGADGGLAAAVFYPPNHTLSLEARVALHGLGLSSGRQLQYNFNEGVNPRPAPGIIMEDVVIPLMDELRRIQESRGFQIIRAGGIQGDSVHNNMKEAIKDYTAGGYTKVNRLNRDNIMSKKIYATMGGRWVYECPEPNASGDTNFSSGLDVMHIKRDMWSAIWQCRFIDLAFDYIEPTRRDIVVFRGVVLQNDHFDVRNGRPYSEIYDPSVMSCSLSPRVSDNFFHSGREGLNLMGYRCCFMMITIKAGSRVIPLENLSFYPGEKEILLRRNSKLKYVATHILKQQNARAVLHEYEYDESEQNPNIYADELDESDFHDVNEVVMSKEESEMMRIWGFGSGIDKDLLEQISQLDEDLFHDVLEGEGLFHDVLEEEGPVGGADEQNYSLNMDVVNMDVVNMDVVNEGVRTFYGVEDSDLKYQTVTDVYLKHLLAKYCPLAAERKPIPPYESPSSSDLDMLRMKYSPNPEQGSSQASSRGTKRRRTY